MNMLLVRPIEYLGFRGRLESQYSDSNIAAAVEDFLKAQLDPGVKSAQIDPGGKASSQCDPGQVARS